MATLCDEIVAEGTALLSITSHLKQFLCDRESERTYLYETQAFFQFIHHALDSIATHVESQVCQAEGFTPTVARSAFSDMKALERIVGQIYFLVRQVSDADTLSIPFPIVVYINSLTKDLPRSSGARGAQILLLATDELNFLHRKLDVLRKMCSVCQIVPDFPGQIGVIAFPYTERTSVCLNALLFHELGHYVFQRGKIGANLEPHLGQLDRRLEEIPVRELFELQILKGQARQRLLIWAEEVFADLFATGVVGPSYAIALGRLIRLSGVDDKSVREFGESHPAPGLRKTLIARLLVAAEWITCLREADPDLATNLEKDAAKEESWIYDIGNSALAAILLEEFQALVPHIEHEVKGIVGHLLSHKEDFAENNKRVIDELKNLVVPQTGRAGGAEISPSPITLLNCGSILLGRKDLGEVFVLCNRSQQKPDDKLWVEDRINRLVMKAVEDCLIGRRWAKP